MRYLHTMLRVRNLDHALDFYCTALGLVEVRRRVDEKGRYTLVFLAAPDDAKPVAESPAKDETAAGDRVAVVDLRQARSDGTYLVRWMSRTDFEQMAVARREKTGPTLAQSAAPGTGARPRTRSGSTGARCGWTRPPRRGSPRI